MKSRLRFSLLLVGLAILLAGCMSDAEAFIQGKWARGNVHYWDEWNFDRGTYWAEYDDTHTNLYEKGSYAVIETGADYLVIELFNRKGSQAEYEENERLRIIFDSAAYTIRIRRSDYLKVDESSLSAISTAQAR